MKPFFNNAAVGGAIGAAAVIVGLVIFGVVVPGRSLDTVSIGILVPAYVLLATLILANTNNSIDARVRSTLDRYESDYKEEIERNRKERQEAIEEVGGRVQTEFTSTMSKLQRRNRNFTLQLLSLIGLYAVVQALNQRVVRTWLRKQVERFRKP